MALFNAAFCQNNKTALSGGRKRMSKGLVILLLCIAVMFPFTAFGVSEVQVNGNLRLSSGSLIFSDGSTQSSAATGTGVSIGITKVVHGLVGANGSSAGAGYSVAHSGTGFYTINFTSSFGAAPTCTVTSLGHQTTSLGYIACELSNVPGIESVTFSCMQYRPVYNSGTSLYEYEEIMTDTPFTFICVQ
jgi:hypothetical protein